MPHRTRLWVGRLALALLVPPLLVEVLLQVAALFMPGAPVDATAAANGPCCVLCVGDSFTFGLGASSSAGSYPSRLEALLASAPIEGRSRVANGGVPSRNSREVLLDLPRLVARERPRFVVILTGVNDAWSRPERADLRVAADGVAGTSPPARLQWRTLKLVRLLLQRSGAAAAVAASERAGRNAAAAKPAEARVVAPEPPSGPEDVEKSFQLVGYWRMGSAGVHFLADGRLRIGADERRWRVARAGRLLVEPGDGAPALEVGAQRSGGRLLLTQGEPPARAVLDRSNDPPSATRPPEGWYPGFDRLRSAGALDEALAVAQRWIADEPDDPGAWSSHFDVANKLNRSDLYDADVRAIARIEAATGTRDAVEALVFVWEATGQRERSWQAAHDAVARFPASGPLHFSAAEAAENGGDLATAVAEMTLSIELDARTPSSYLGCKHRERARWRAKLGRGVDACCDLIEAMRADPDPKLDVQLLTRMPFDLGWLDEAARRTNATEEERATVRRRHAESLEAKTSPSTSTLADHLAQMVRWLREQGAEPVLCTYPFFGPFHDGAQREVAAREHVRLVDLAPRFAELLKQRRREELFVTDGHCNDAGYAIVAEEVAAVLRGVAH